MPQRRCKFTANRIKSAQTGFVSFPGGSAADSEQNATAMQLSAQGQWLAFCNHRIIIDDLKLASMGALHSRGLSRFVTIIGRSIHRRWC